jgi:uncharacterized protein (DUF2147 family)
VLLARSSAAARHGREFREDVFQKDEFQGEIFSMTQYRQSAFLRLAGIAAAGTCLAAIATPVLAQSILGNWRTKSGAVARIAPCGAAYCITLRSGKHKGKRIGRLTGKGASYSGTVTDPNNGKVYTGKASVRASSMSLSGCVLGFLCKSETWTRR